MRIDFHGKLKKRYKKIPAHIRDKFNERLQLFESNPSHPLLYNHALQGDRAGEWSINITGDWRAVYVFQDSETIVFTDIDTHSNLYK